MNTKFKNKILSITTASLIMLSTYSSVGAHPGRTDSQGGHYVRTAGWGYKVGSYHYHSGSSKSKSTSANKKSTSSNTSSTSNLKKIQQRLNALGYNCGVADGKMGTKTKNAIKSFQKKNGLVADGIAGASTTKRLFK